MKKKNNYNHPQGTVSLWNDMARSFHALSSRSKAHKDKYFTIAKTIVDINPSNIIDLGCGSGLLENELIKLNYGGKIVAVDGSIEMLKIAKTLCGDKVDFIELNLDNGIKLGKKFDVVVAINVLFFIKDKKIFLRSAHDMLKDNDSVLLVINPKPNDKTNNWEFVKAHFSNTSFLNKILILSNEFINIPRYIKMIVGQNELTKMAKRGEIVFDSAESMEVMANNAGLKIRSIEDIHAGQNWLFVMSLAS